MKDSLREALTLNHFPKLYESIFLVEDIAAVQKQYKHIPEEDFWKIIHLDPTYNPDRDSVGKYGKWLLGLYKKDNPLQYDNVSETIAAYDDAKNDRNKVVEKDINKFKSIEDMANEVANAGEAELTNRQKQRGSKKGYKMIYDDGKWAIFEILTKEGSIALGKGSNWCTADSRTNYYESYLRENGGRYYVIMDEANPKDKYQVHFESQQLFAAGCSKDGYNGEECELEASEFFSDKLGVRKFFEDMGYDCDDMDNNDSIPDQIKNVLKKIWQYEIPGGQVDYHALQINVFEDPSVIQKLVEIDKGWELVKIIWQLFNGLADEEVISRASQWFNLINVFKIVDNMWHRSNRSSVIPLQYSEELNEVFPEVMARWINQTAPTTCFLDDVIMGIPYCGGMAKVSDSNILLSIPGFLLGEELMNGSLKDTFASHQGVMPQSQLGKMVRDIIKPMVKDSTWFDALFKKYISDSNANISAIDLLDAVIEGFVKEMARGVKGDQPPEGFIEALKSSGVDPNLAIPVATEEDMVSMMDQIDWYVSELMIYADERDIYEKMEKYIQHKIYDITHNIAYIDSRDGISYYVDNRDEVYANCNSMELKDLLITFEGGLEALRAEV